MGMAGEFEGKPAGSISVRFMRDARETASQAMEEIQKQGVKKIGAPAMISAIMETGETVEQAVETANDWQSGLAEVASKLEILVELGDKLAQVRIILSFWSALFI
jgi:hypothetical protein